MLDAQLLLLLGLVASDRRFGEYGPERFARKALTQAQKAIQMSEQYWPHAFVFTLNRQIDVFVFEPDILASRSRTTQLLRSLQAAAISVNGLVVLIYEVGTSPQEVRAKNAQGIRAIIRHGIDNHPQQTDCLTISVFGPALTPMLGKQKYSRDESTGTYIFEPLQWLPSDSIQHLHLGPGTTSARKADKDAPNNRQ